MEHECLRKLKATLRSSQSGLAGARHHLLAPEIHGAVDLASWLLLTTFWRPPSYCICVPLPRVLNISELVRSSVNPLNSRGRCHTPTMAQPAPPGPTPQQMQAMQAAIAAEAQKRGMTVEQFQAEQRAKIEADAKAQGLTPEQYVAKLRAEAFANHQRQMVQAQLQQQMQGQQQGGQAPQAPLQGAQAVSASSPQQQQQQVPINPNQPPNPQAIALLKWLRGQDLKMRTCILNGQRKDMFKGTLVWFRSLSRCSLFHSQACSARH